MSPGRASLVSACGRDQIKEKMKRKNKTFITAITNRPGSPFLQVGEGRGRLMAPAAEPHADGKNSELLWERAPRAFPVREEPLRPAIFSELVIF